ncbi:hypothetical protein CJ030_MR0G005283 [Morella rubra]|uniref:Core-2/I-branching beta-1,6-N-acetylglucosaminyltransferase family protein n=1 Tax=Morella rubra TaxID=262757 RepID=A0A6A1UML4_9ROSI|nr:hypothetical protein CJ030_MR0G005283 [Morella rubra]
MRDFYPRLSLRNRFGTNPTKLRRNEFQFEGPPKIAFLFLVRQDLPLDFVWDIFFKGGVTANFSIYVHSEPGFVFNETTRSSSFFYGRQLNNSVQVVWGELTMIEAVPLSLKNALNDPANERFVLLSDSCIPLHNFIYTYNSSMSSQKSFVDSFLDVKDKRYHPKMSPTIPKEKWRKGSQWITLIGRHAEIVADDEIIFPVFRWKKCDDSSSCLLEMHSTRNALHVCKQDFDSGFTFPWLKLKHHSCISDEHYVQALLADINHVHYESSNRTERCQISSKPAPCYFFARKFTRRAGIRLLNAGLAVLMAFMHCENSHT